MKRLMFAMATAAVMLAAADESPISPDLTIAHLNSVIAAQELTIRSLQAQLNELQGKAQIQADVYINIGKMKAACEAKGTVLMVNAQTGLYTPDKQGKPYCVDVPKKENNGHKN